MSIFLIVAFFMVLMVAIAAYGYQRYARPGQVYERLGEPVIETPTAGSPEDAEARKPREFKLIQRVGELMPVSSDEGSVTLQMLTHAGYRSDNALKIYYGIRILSTVILGLFGLVFRNSVTDKPSMHIIFPLAMALAGFILPNFILEKRIKKRLDILRLISGEGLRLIVLGGVAGLGAALATAQLLKSLLYNVGPRDPAIYGAVALLLALVAFVATLIPARAAMRVEPAEALRYE